MLDPGASLPFKNPRLVNGKLLHNYTPGGDADFGVVREGLQQHGE